MSGLIGALLNGAQSLTTQSQGVQIAGKNLANSNTAGYARQRMIVDDLGSVQTSVGTQSMGNHAVGLQQIRDKFLDAQVTREISQTSSLQAQDENLQKAQSDLGEQVDSTANATSITDTTHSTNGISSALNDFFNAFESLSANPTDVGAKQLLLQKADLLTNKINVTDSRLSSLQSDITAQNKGDLETTNGLLKDIASLNSQIQKVEINSSDSAVDLRDQRQAKLEELAKYMDFSTRDIPDSHGQIQVLAHDSSGGNVVLVDRANALGNLSYDEATKEFSGGAPATVLSLSGGSLHGNVVARDGVIQQLRDDIAAMAQQLTTSVNKTYNADGTGNNFFAAPPSSGLIALDSTLQVSTIKTSSNGDAGGNDVALAVAGVANQTFSTASGDGINGTISGFYSTTTSGFGQALAGVESKLVDQETVQNLVSAQRDSVSGVSMDEEMTDLMKYQRGFQASARVINVIDNLLDVVVNGLVK